MTMNGTWGYTEFDDAWKSPALLLHTLIETVSMGGNLLLNVGPMGDGLLTPQEIERLAALASWRERHGESLEDVKLHEHTYTRWRMYRQRSPSQFWAGHTGRLSARRHRHPRERHDRSRGGPVIVPGRAR